jgi:hypothetical protein
MNWIPVIVVLAVLLLLFIIYATLMHHNKYFFWKFPRLVPDRNGARKPGEKAPQIYGTEMPTAKNDRAAVLQTVLDPNTVPNEQVQLEIDESNHEFRVRFTNGTLNHGGLRIRAGGQYYSSRVVDIDPKDQLGVKTLKIQSYKTENSADHLGEFIVHYLSWYSIDKDVLILTSIRQYTTFPCIMFRVEFPLGLGRTYNPDYNTPCIEFPVFNNESNRSLVFTYSQTNFSEPTNVFPKSGTSSPLLFYNEDLETMIFAPTMNFLTAWHCPSDNQKFEIRLGLEGNLQSLPENFMHESMLLFDRGISRTWDDWGNLLLHYYQRNRQPFNIDTVVAYLGYWTDAGTYYYYNHKPFPNYEDALVAVRDRAKLKNIPYRYWQLDSWFYPKDDGTLTWEPDPKLFPTGLAWLSERLGGPFICHNRWFSVHTSYKAKYPDFITESHDPAAKPGSDPKNVSNKKIRRWSLPTKPDVWTEIMQTARTWNCICYEQDWLQPQWKFFDYLRENVHAGRMWLKGMAEAAYNSKMTMQFCMTFPSFYLAAIELPNVSHARCSDDYNHRKAKRIYVPHFTQTAMLCWACGLFPWKDPFFSTCDPEPGSVSIFQRIPAHYERWSVLELLLQVLSAGPVGNGDQVDKLNAPLLLQSCREDGLLIKPDRPLFPIDLMFLPHSKPYVMMTYSAFGPFRWYYLLQVLVWDKKVTEYFVTLNDLGIKGKFIAYDYFEKKIFPVDETTPIGKGRKMCLNEHNYTIIAPIMDNGMAFIGLRDKIATMSGIVFEKVELQGQGLFIQGTYAARTEFAVVAYVPKQPTLVKVNGLETKTYTWGRHYNTFTIVIRTDDEPFTLYIE